MNVPPFAIHVLEFEPVKLLYVTDIELSWCGWDMGSWQILAKTWAQHVGSSLRDRGPSADVPAPAGRILGGGFSGMWILKAVIALYYSLCFFLDWLAIVKFLRTDRIKLRKNAFTAVEFSVLFAGQPHPTPRGIAKHVQTLCYRIQLPRLVRFSMMACICDTRALHRQSIL